MTENHWGPEMIAFMRGFGAGLPVGCYFPLAVDAGLQAFGHAWNMLAGTWLRVCGIVDVLCCPPAQSADVIEVQASLLPVPSVAPIQSPGLTCRPGCRWETALVTENAANPAHEPCCPWAPVVQVALGLRGKKTLQPEGPR